MNVKNILRWSAMPFASVIGSCLAYFLVTIWIQENNIGYQLYTGLKVTSITQILLSIFAQGLFGGAFVYLGSLVAPSNKRICAIVLATIISTLSIIALVASILYIGFSFMQLIYILAIIVGSIITVNLVTEEMEDNALEF